MVVRNIRQVPIYRLIENDFLWFSHQQGKNLLFIIDSNFSFLLLRWLSKVNDFSFISGSIFENLNINTDDCDYNEENFIFDDWHSNPIQEESPLCKGVNISLENSLLLHLVFSRRHNLTKAALKDLLTLTALHLSKPNNFPTTVHQMYSALGLQENEVSNVYFCGNCNTILKDSAENCVICPDQKTEHFVYNSVESQLKTILKSKLIP